MIKEKSMNNQVNEIISNLKIKVLELPHISLSAVSVKKNIRISRY